MNLLFLLKKLAQRIGHMARRQTSVDSRYRDQRGEIEVIFDLDIIFRALGRHLHQRMSRASITGRQRINTGVTLQRARSATWAAPAAT